MASDTLKNRVMPIVGGLVVVVGIFELLGFEFFTNFFTWFLYGSGLSLGLSLQATLLLFKFSIILTGVGLIFKKIWVLWVLGLVIIFLVLFPLIGFFL